MLNNPHIIAVINGIILVIAGLFSFFVNPERPVTALIAPVAGIIIIILSPAMKKGNKLISHIIAGLTLIFAIQTAIMAFSSSKIEDSEKRNRRVAVFSIMSLSCFAATSLYTARFINIRKAKSKE